MSLVVKRIITLLGIIIVLSIGSIFYQKQSYYDLQQKYPLCYEKMTTVFKKLYHCSLENVEEDKNICNQSISENDFAEMKSGCEQLIEKINIVSCSKKGITTDTEIFQCVLDKLDAK